MALVTQSITLLILAASRLVVKRSMPSRTPLNMILPSVQHWEDYDECTIIFIITEYEFWVLLFAQLTDQLGSAALM